MAHLSAMGHWEPPSPKKQYSNADCDNVMGRAPSSATADWFFFHGVAAERDPPSNYVVHDGDLETLRVSSDKELCRISTALHTAKEAAVFAILM
jgi:hypothetical protein